MQAIVQNKVTSDLPSSPTPFNDDWKHLVGLELADPDFGSPGAIDLLLGTELFVQIVLHGRQFGPHGSPMALKPTLDGFLVALFTASSSRMRRLVAW